MMEIPAGFPADAQARMAAAPVLPGTDIGWIVRPGRSREGRRLLLSWGRTTVDEAPTRGFHGGGPARRDCGDRDRGRRPLLGGRGDPPAADRPVHQPVLLRDLLVPAPHSGGPSPGLVVGVGPGRRRPDHRADGP